MMSAIGDSPSYQCGVISPQPCRPREIRTRPAPRLLAVPTAESARHEVDQRAAPARPTARATHAHSPAAPLHHRAPGSREGGQYRRSTNIREARSDWSRDARQRPRASTRRARVFRIGRWREPARAQHGDAIAAIHLGLCRIAKMCADRPRRGRDEATRCKQRHGANQRRLINCQTAGDPVAEGVSDQVRRTTADRLYDASDITGQIVQGRAIEGTATAADATDIYRDRLESSGNQRARQ